MNFKIYDGREHFYQWDLNRKLIVENPDIKEVHFCNRTDDCSLVCEVFEENKQRLVNVPNILLQTDWRIKAYAYDGNCTKYEETFTVTARTKPADYAYTETEILNWNAIDTKVKAAIEEMNEVKEEGSQVIEEAESILADISTEAQQLQENNKQAEALIETVNNEVNRLNTSNDTAQELLGELDAAIGSANEATTLANLSAGAAQNAANKANAATDKANAATTKTTTATEAAYSAISKAETATQNAQEATSGVQLIKDQAVEATDNANAAAVRANEAAQGINGKFANALKGEASGTIVSIKDVSPIEHEMNVKVSSKNLIPLPSYHPGAEYTSNGIKFIDNGDGSITASGTATANANFLFQGVTRDKQIPIAKGTYVLSGATLNTRIAIGISTSETSGRKTYNAYYNLPIVISVDNETTRFDIVAVVDAGKTVSNTVIKPKLEKGIVATDYTPYVDVSAVKLKKQGKNILPYPYATPTKTLNGITFTDNGDGTITANGTATNGNAVFDMVGDRTTPWGKCNLPAGSYFFSGCAANGSGSTYRMFFALRNADGASIVDSSDKGEGLKINIAENATQMYCRIIVYNGTTVSNLTFKPMLSIDTTATDYEPYIAPVEVDPDEVMSLYPTTTLYTDSTDVLIEVEYNKDINKAFEELYKAIISLGGNV